MTTDSTTMTLDSLPTLPPTLTLEEAAQLLRIGRSSAYTLAQHGEFPVPVLRVGKLYRVPTAGVLQALGVNSVSPDLVDSGSDCRLPACADATSRASISPTC